MIINLLLAIIPSRVRVFIMRLCGASIGKNCHIGVLTYINSVDITIGDNVQIASFNLIHRLRRLEMASGSRMNGFNWITGAGTGTFKLGANSAITRLHFFEASASIEIMENAIIAGRNSHFFTHGITSSKLDDMRSIIIGPWSYIGSSSRFVPGSGVGEGTFVAMGSVVSKLHTESYVLLAGVPAKVKKNLSPTDVYFARKFLPHDHHLPEYNGGVNINE